MVKDIGVPGIEVSTVTYREQRLWSIDPAPLTSRRGRGTPYEINTWTV
jgi:hypothetical protein